MKTLRKVGLSFMAVAMCFGMASCSNDDDDDSPATPAVEETPIEDYLNMPTDVVLPKSSNYVMDPVQIEVEDETSGIKTIKLTQNSVAYIETLEELEPSTTRASRKTKNLFGFYTLNGKNVTIAVPNFGTITFTYSTNLREIVLKDKAYKATLASIPAAGAINMDNLMTCCWWPAEYRAIVMFDKLVAYNKGKSTIAELQADLNKELKPSKELHFFDDDLTLLGFWAENGYWSCWESDGVWTRDMSGVFTWTDMSKGKLNIDLDGKNYDVDVRFRQEDYKGGNGLTYKLNALYFIINTDYTALSKDGVHTIRGKFIIKLTDNSIKWFN